MEEEDEATSLGRPAALATRSSVAARGLPQDEGSYSYERRYSRVSYQLHLWIAEVAASDTREEVWSCLLVLVLFWSIASMTMIFGFYGSVSLHLGSDYSRLIETSPFLVQTIVAEKINNELKPGPVLYGFYEPPALDVEVTWTETHNVVVPVNFHKEWVYFLNKGSKVDILYKVKSPSSSSPLSLIISQGRESLVEWIKDPSYPNTTLSWNIICGNGSISQEILMSSDHYIALGNLNSEDVEVELELSVKAVTYNTSRAYYKCWLGSHRCSLKLSLLGTNAVVLASPNRDKGVSDDGWNVRLSYGPRWTVYFLGSGFGLIDTSLPHWPIPHALLGIMSLLSLLAFRFCNADQPSNAHGDHHQQGGGSRRAPLLGHKDDDACSMGSSYESISNDDDDLDEGVAANSSDRAVVSEGEAGRRLCIVCFEGERDCFFLPCGHCAACIPCGTRTKEEARTCPICRRSIKKVRKIITV